MLRVTAFGLMLLTFFGSVGVLIYSHTCLHEQITINTLFTASDHCESDHVGQVADNCCDVPEKREAAKNNHCCSESVSAVYLSFSFFEQAQDMQYTLPVSPLVVREMTGFVPKQRKELLSLAADPDPPSGREILTRICIWRL